MDKQTLEMPDGRHPREITDLCHATTFKKDAMERLIEAHKAGTFDNHTRNPEALHMIVPEHDVATDGDTVSLTDEADDWFSDNDIKYRLESWWQAHDGKAVPALVIHFATHTLKDRYMDRDFGPSPVEDQAKDVDAH